MISLRSLLLATCLLASAGNAAAGYMPPESSQESASYTHTPDGVGLLIAENKNGTTRHIYADAQGSTRLVTDAQGNTLETLDFDAFGNETATNTKETRHRYTGEAYDATTGLYHLRARDYDPATGRFISMDEHPGSQRIPLSLNKYLYGNADPVNTIDPSGNFTLGGVMSGIGNFASLSLRAFNFYTNFIEPAAESFDLEIPTLWDALMQMTLGGAMGLLNSMESRLDGVTSRQMSFPFGGKTIKHHTIPVYLCGAQSEKIQPLATINKDLHDALHNSLDKMVAAVNYAGTVVDLIFHKNKARSTRPTIMRVARTKGGRMTIAEALYSFYLFNDLLGEGGDVLGTYSIEEAFMLYAPRYVFDRKQTSLSHRCSRSYKGK